MLAKQWRKIKAKTVIKKDCDKLMRQRQTGLEREA